MDDWFYYWIFLSVDNLTIYSGHENFKHVLLCNFYPILCVRHFEWYFLSHWCLYIYFMHGLSLDILLHLTCFIQVPPLISAELKMIALNVLLKIVTKSGSTAAGCSMTSTATGRRKNHSFGSVWAIFIKLMWYSLCLLFCTVVFITHLQVSPAG